MKISHGSTLLGSVSLLCCCWGRSASNSTHNCSFPCLSFSLSGCAPWALNLHRWVHPYCGCSLFLRNCSYCIVPLYLRSCSFFLHNGSYSCCSAHDQPDNFQSTCLLSLGSDFNLCSLLQDFGSLLTCASQMFYDLNCDWSLSATQTLPRHWFGYLTLVWAPTSL